MRFPTSTFLRIKFLSSRAGLFPPTEAGTRSAKLRARKRKPELADRQSRKSMKKNYSGKKKPKRVESMLKRVKRMLKRVERKPELSDRQARDREPLKKNPKGSAPV